MLVQFFNNIEYVYHTYNDISPKNKALINLNNISRTFQSILSPILVQLIFTMNTTKLNNLRNKAVK